MKKSRAIRLALLGSAGLTLAACDEAPPADAQFYSSLQECTARQGETACREGLAKSEQEHLAEAPRYSRQEQCEQEFGAGNCESHGSGVGSFFLPMMMGYMIGNRFSQPVYRDSQNNAVVRSGNGTYRVGTLTGTGRAGSFTPAAATPIQRGGLGSTASRYNTASAGG